MNKRHDQVSVAIVMYWVTQVDRNQFLSAIEYLRGKCESFKEFGICFLPYISKTETDQYLTYYFYVAFLSSILFCFFHSIFFIFSSFFKLIIYVQSLLFSFFFSSSFLAFLPFSQFHIIPLGAFFLLIFHFTIFF